MSNKTEYDVVGAMMDFEGGMMQSDDEVITLFQHLVDTGLTWQLQGSYGRMAQQMIEGGHING